MILAPALPPPAGRGPLLVRGGTVVTVDPDLGVLPHGDVLLDGEMITAVAADLGDRITPDTAVMDATGLAVLPGFVDSHLHAWEGQLRGLGPTADFAAYLGLTAFGYGPRYTPRDCYAGTFVSALAALDAGITTVVDNAHNALSRDHAAAGVEALLDAGIRGVCAVGSPFGSELDHLPATVLALREQYTGPLLDVRLFEVHPTPQLWRFALDHGLWVSTELGPHTPDLVQRFEGLRAAGLLGPQHAFNHCYDLPARVWDLVAESGAAVNLCPRSDAAYGLGSTVPPVGPALASGAAVGLSNDNELSYGIDMFAEMQTLLLRDRGEQFRRTALGEPPRPAALEPSQLLAMATLGGAANAGLADRVGSLTPGKQADLVLVRTDGPATLSTADPVASVVTMAHRGMVDTVLVAGQVRKWQGRLTNVDAATTEDLLVESRRRLAVA